MFGVFNKESGIQTLNTQRAVEGLGDQVIKLESSQTCETILRKMPVSARKPHKPQQPLYNCQP